MKDLYTLDELNNRIETELYLQKLVFVPLCCASAFFGAFVMLLLSYFGII